MSVVSQGISPHPVALTLGDELAMVLVQDQPDATDRIYFGAPELGWAGEASLGLYYWPRSDPRKSTYTVMKLCSDGEYRFICEMPGDRKLSPASVNQLIRRLIQIDSHRGFDAHVAVTAHNDRLEAERERNAEEWATEEMAPRLAWAYARDRGHLTLGNRRFDHPGINAPWKHDDAEAAQPGGA